MVDHELTSVKQMGSRVPDLRHCCKTSAMRSGPNPLVADAIMRHGDRKKDVKSVCLSTNV